MASTPPTPRVPRRCPCGLGASYAECCRPLHRGRGSGRVTAPTAERLMRSRFSAFAVGDPAYLLTSWHPSTRPPALELDPGLTWRRLEILGTTAGGEDDDAGTVAFVAHFWDDTARRRGEQREDSTFVRQDGQWYYVDART
jgi:SEC-C motif-containing protein